MAVSHAVPRWETRSLDCWAKAKELRRDAYGKIMEAKEEGKLVISYWGEFLRPLLQGVEHECLVSEAYSATVATFEDLARECLEAVDNWGFMPDLCAYARLYWGSMLLNKSPWGPFPKPDLLIQDVSGCNVHNKFPQFVSETLGIPCFLIDTPKGGRRRFDDPEDFELGKELYIDNIVGQLHDLIQWLEEKSGQRFDDGRFLEALRYQREHRILWSKVFYLNQAIPAPLDTKSLYSLVTPAIQLGGRKEAADFYRILYDEVKWRAENHIAALATERCRLVEDNIPPWYAMHIERYVNKWGASFVASPYLMLIGGLDCDGERFLIPKSFEEEGRLMSTQEDALRFMAEESATRMNRSIKQMIHSIEFIIREWKADGAVLRTNLGCTGRVGLQEACYVLRQHGIPTMTYQTSLGDRRGWNEAQVMDNLESFLEGTLGLTRLAD